MRRVLSGLSRGIGYPGFCAGAGGGRPSAGTSLLGAWLLETTGLRGSDGCLRGRGEDARLSVSLSHFLEKTMGTRRAALKERPFRHRLVNSVHTGPERRRNGGGTLRLCACGRLWACSRDCGLRLKDAGLRGPFTRHPVFRGVPEKQSTWNCPRMGDRMRTVPAVDTGGSRWARG